MAEVPQYLEVKDNKIQINTLEDVSGITTLLQTDLDKGVNVKTALDTYISNINTPSSGQTPISVEGKRLRRDAFNRLANEAKQGDTLARQKLANLLGLDTISAKNQADSNLTATTKTTSALEAAARQNNPKTVENKCVPPAPSLRMGGANTSANCETLKIQ